MGQTGDVERMGEVINAVDVFSVYLKKKNSLGHLGLKCKNQNWGLVGFCICRFVYVKVKGKVVPLHAMEALWVRGGVAPALP
jgi:hypothetical protein